jgi:hypothetical protein
MTFLMMWLWRVIGYATIAGVLSGLVLLAGAAGLISLNNGTKKDGGTERSEALSRTDALMSGVLISAISLFICWVSFGRAGQDSALLQKWAKEAADKELAEPQAAAAPSAKAEIEQVAASENPCESKWDKCTDNADLAKHYSGWYGIAGACEVEAGQQSRFGTPNFGPLPFTAYADGKDYVQTGVAIVAATAQFQNGFGAMVNSTVICNYDLRTSKVIGVDITTP